MNDAEMIRVLKGIKESLNDDILSHGWEYNGFCDWLALNCGTYVNADLFLRFPHLIKGNIKEVLWDSFQILYPYSVNFYTGHSIGRNDYWFARGHIDGRLKVVDHALNKLTCSKGTK